MSDIFFIADPHYSHSNIALHCWRFPWLYENPDYDPSQPYHFKYNNPWAVNIRAHDEALIENWNKMVKQGNTTYVLGDFAFRDHNHYLMALNGKKILSFGNHDKASREVYKNFTETHEMNCRKSINGQDITIGHYAMRVWANSCHGSWSLYGHSHGRLPEFNNMLTFDVGVDVWGYAPVPWDAIVKKMQIKIDWIRANGKYPADGETKADGQYDKSPNVRVLETRQQNKEIIKSLGYPIDENMWPNSLPAQLPDCQQDTE